MNRPAKTRRTFLHTFTDGTQVMAVERARGRQFDLVWQTKLQPGHMVEFLNWTREIFDQVDSRWAKRSGPAAWMVGFYNGSTSPRHLQRVA